MKIGIVGNYGNNNNGDEAILLSILSLVKNTFSQEIDFVVFSNNPAQTAERYGVESHPLYYKSGNAVKTFFETYKRNSQVVKDFDLLIIGGGGILMDLYKREAPLYGSYAMMAKNSNVPYVVYGCGAGPLTTSLGKWFIRYMCKHADSVSVRDPESKQLLQSIGVKKDVQVVGDPAFSLKQDNKEQSQTPKKIGVTAVPYYNAAYWPEGNEAIYSDYISGMAKNLDEIAKKHEVEFVFFATKYPQDADVTKDIFEMMEQKGNIEIVDQNLLPEDLLDVIGVLDVLIGTRLHSLILATDTQTPLMAVSYHPKVNDFMKLARLDKYSFKIEELNQNPTLFLAAFEEMKSNWPGTVQQIEGISDELYQKAVEGSSQFINAVNKR